jgi:hypothetical protein
VIVPRSDQRYLVGICLGVLPVRCNDCCPICV